MRDALLKHIANMEELVIEHVDFLRDKPSHDVRSMGDALSLGGGLLRPLSACLHQERHMTLPLALRMQSVLMASAKSLLMGHVTLVTAFSQHRLLTLRRHMCTDIEASSLPLRILGAVGLGRLSVNIEKAAW